MVWLVSVASKKVGDDMEENSSTSLELVARWRSFTYGAMLLMMARRAG